MIKIKIEKDSMFLSFPYDSHMVDVIREFPNRKWDKENKEWQLPLEKLDKLISKLPEQEFEITGEYVEMGQKEVKIPDGFSFKTKPFQHQLDAFKYGLSHDRWFLGDEMGLGKSKQAIDIAIAKKMERRYKHCLIICGVNSLKWNWVNEVHTHSNEDAWILGQQTKKGKVTVGGNKEKYRQIQKLDDLPYFIITNVESLRDNDITSEIASMCKSGDIGMVVCDEIHKMKNPSSQQGKAFLKLQPETRIAMTGTPLMNSPLDLYVILKWLGYEDHAFYSFRNHYCEMGGFGGYQIVGYKNMGELREKLDDIMLRRLKEEVLDLPEKTYIDEYVEMSTKQRKIYDEVTAEIKNNIDQIKMAPNPLAELIRMRQATGFTGILSSTIQESAKLDRMEEIVEEAIKNEKKVVIFSNWEQMTVPIYKTILNKYRNTFITGGYITGKINTEQRQEAVKKFQEDKRCKFIVGTIGAMGTGLTLTAGTVVIFMDEPWTMAAKEQAEDRCHRVGTTENITIYTIMCKDSIDERIHDIVMQKGEMSDSIIDGKIADRSAIVDYLLD